MGDAQVVSAHEFLRQQGSSYIVLHPVPRLLFLGYGYDEVPRAVPHCIAYHQGKKVTKQPTAGSAAVGSWSPDAKAFETLVEVHKVLHLQPPPEPSGLHDTQQQQHPSSSSQSSIVAGTESDLFPSAKAGLVSSRQVAEGTDKFSWFNTQRAVAPAVRSSQVQQHQAGGMIPVHATNGQLQQVSNSRSQQNGDSSYVPHVTGSQVAALSKDEPYAMHWLMTDDGHITGFGMTPEHTLLERFESVWRWAMQAELGIPAAQLSQLSVVLLVPHTMTAAEVRFLADVLLERLGFASLVVHLDSVAATFGNGATSACVVQMDSSMTNIMCVDDAVVLQPASSRRQVSLGLKDVAAALIGWMSCYRHWPTELQAAGLGVACALGCSAGVYGVLMLQELVMQQCYCPKESLTLGLVGRAMLEDQPPAVLPVRTPGKPTINYRLSLGSWAAIAAMVYFYPALAPTQQQLAAPAAAAGSPTAAPSSSESPSEDEDYMGLQYQHLHANVHDFPAAESMYLQGQLKARIEAGDNTPPPIGMYLPALEMPGPSKGDNDDPDNPSEPLTRVGSGVGPGSAAVTSGNAATAAAAGGAAAVEAAAGAAAAERIPLDEAIFKSIVTAAAGRHDVFERLCNGILLVGPGAALRGLGPMLERRLMQRFSSAGRQQVVNVLEQRAHPTHIAWKGAALLAALDAGRENWLPRHQWVQGGMVLRPPVAAKAGKQAKTGQNGAGTPAAAASNSLSTAAAGRHAKLCYYIKAEQGQL